MSKRYTGHFLTILTVPRMYDLKVNDKHNVMMIAIDGRMDMEEATAYNVKYKECIDHMQPGFAVIVDLTNFIATEEHVRVEMKKANAYAVEKGLGRVIRVVPGDMSSTVGNIQLNRQARELGYKTEVVSSVEEAKALLGLD
jgi:hypothetical protein